MKKWNEVNEIEVAVKTARKNVLAGAMRLLRRKALQTVDAEGNPTAETNKICSRIKILMQMQNNS